MKFMPFCLHILWIVLGVYILISVLLYYFKLPKDFNFYYENQQGSEYNLATRDGAIINGLHFSVEKPLGVVLYLKGNSKNIKGWGKFAVDFMRNKYDIIMIDYRGFGKSTVKRSQKTIKHDLQFIYNKIREKVSEKYIIIYGRSLGSGFATKLASINNPKMLILGAPYYSLAAD